MASACSIRVRGIVQGVGFRPFVYRLAQDNTLAGWVLNGEQGVEIFLEGPEQRLADFVRDLKLKPPPAASIAEIEVAPAQPQGLDKFTIRESQRLDRPTVRISPDLPVCDDCLRELFDPADRHFSYAYINCTNCGPRYTVVEKLPYDRPNTTMKKWPLDEYCEREYHDPANRRFHAQPVACPECGPQYYLQQQSSVLRGQSEVVAEAAKLLRDGQILAMKGLGGYHLACDARNTNAVTQLRERKYRKEKPFAVMVKDLPSARTLIELSPQAEALITSTARPIVLAPAKVELPQIAPDTNELGVMLPYTPLQHLLFAAGAPDVLVMTSANRSSEPIAYEDEDALERLSGIADAFLIGERPIARRVDDSVARIGAFGPVILRRARGYAPSAVVKLPGMRPILALGADLKNTITLVVDGQAFVSQHLGDLEHYQAFQAFKQTIRDLVSMYDLNWNDLLIVRDLHPQYFSSAHAAALRADGAPLAVQHHRAHIASVLAEHEAWERRVLGVSCDGTGFGEDGTIWGCEFFVGSLQTGFDRVAHLRPAALPGGDAAAEYPVQATAGFLAQLEDLPDLTARPFLFGSRYKEAIQLVQKRVRAFTTTSMGRLFDTAAALLGFTRPISYEGQAAMWLEQLARKSGSDDAFPFPFSGGELDFRPLLEGLIRGRLSGRAPQDLARAFQRGLARGLGDAIITLCRQHALDTVVLSGGVFQNELLLEDVKAELAGGTLQIWTNHAVPPNDGGISLGQAALAAFSGIANERSGTQCTNSR
ncbi:MAG TPA: carbamoyltransferase HypF [Candidatus Angelobacter sp.]|nr:carbamoyltransferase HypF [Candidatus Angelobacter sp.]